MFCRNCGEEVGFERECPKCGSFDGEGRRFCPNCGKKVSRIAGKCKHCGTLLCEKNEDLESPGEYLNGYNKYLIALTALFFGGIGLHCFIIGDHKRAWFRILYTLLFGAGIVIAVIDAVLILCGRYRTDPEGFLEMALW